MGTNKFKHGQPIRDEWITIKKGEHAFALISSAECFKLSVVELREFRRFVGASALIYVGRADDEIVCLWGLVPPTLLSTQAYLWLHTTEAVKGNEFLFIRRSQIVMREMLERFPSIIGHCEAHATQSIRWLRFLGAKFQTPMGKLVPFVIEA